MVKSKENMNDNLIMYLSYGGETNLDGGVSPSSFTFRRKFKYNDDVVETISNR